MTGSEEELRRILGRHMHGLVPLEVPAYSPRSKPAPRRQRPPMVNPRGPRDQRLRKRVLEVMRTDPQQWWNSGDVQRTLGYKPNVIGSLMRKMALDGLLVRKHTSSRRCRYKISGSGVIEGPYRMKTRDDSCR